MSEHAKIVTARRPYRCPAEWFHDPAVRPGEQYIRVTRFPNYLETGVRIDMAAYHPDCYDGRISDE